MLCPYLLLGLRFGTIVRSSPMTLILEDDDEMLSAAIAGVPRIAEFIATVPAEERTRALEAAEKSYLETAHTLGYQDADARQWVSTVMSRLQSEEDSYKLRMLTSAPTSPG
jgi:hypothetical protein